MSEQLQLRRGSVSQVVGFIGAQGECVVDTTNNRLVVSDNATQGGWPAAKLSEVQTTLRASVPDANYPLTAPANSSTPWVTMIAYTALTAARTVNLPAASTFPTGTKLTVVDETGACSATLTITVAPHGTDLINGVNGSIVINQAFGSVVLESNGSNAWVIVSWWYSTTARKIVQSPSGATMSVNQIEFTTGLFPARLTPAQRRSRRTASSSRSARASRRRSPIQAHRLGGPAASAGTRLSSAVLPPAWALPSERRISD